LSDVNVEVIKNSISQASGEYLVTAGNSFGFMDGGIDGYINEMISFRKEPRFNVIVRKHISEAFDGLLPVGQSTILSIDNTFVNFKYLVYCPTMIIPENVNNTLNAFYAYRGSLLAIKNILIIK
jgi:O-acetyl-ADP-ribose deacetylase (regulator of RNase III)